ncbi:MAG: ATP-binding protein [Thiohalomonadaceae bacterium]
MGSLFTKIFISFWLAALLLAAAVFMVERTLDDDALAQAVERADAHAETVAALLADEGLPAVNRWLHSMARDERVPLLLLNADGRPLANQPFGRRLREHLQRDLTPGVHAVVPGVFTVVRPVPATDPPLYIATVARTGRIHRLSFAERLLVAVAVSGLVSFGLATLLTRPLRRLRRAAQAIAQGDLSARAGFAGRDEIAALAADFDLMAERVRDLLESQRRLLRDISHELRSPLARLRIALELSRRKGGEGMELERIEREADRLEHLVSDVLSLARLEAGKTRLNRQPVQLRDWLDAIVQDAAFEAEAAHKHVVFVPGADACLEADPVLLRSAVENVLRNAVRHTPEAGQVHISLDIDGDKATITVRDSGPGVPDDELTHIFQPFTRVGEARDRHSGGFGLGLAISRQAVEVHGGEIIAKNAPEGGLSVSMLLPRNPERAKRTRSKGDPGV